MAKLQKTGVSTVLEFFVVVLGAMLASASCKPDTSGTAPAVSVEKGSSSSGVPTVEAPKSSPLPRAQPSAPSQPIANRLPAAPAGPAAAPTLGSTCAGSTLTIKMPPGRILDPRRKYAVLFSPCGVVATAAPPAVTANSVTVVVPASAKSGPVWVRDLEGQFVGQINNCLKSTKGLNQLRDACSFDASLLTGSVLLPRRNQFKGICRALGMDPVFMDHLAAQTLKGCGLDCIRSPIGSVGTIGIDRTPDLRVTLATAGEFKADATTEAEFGRRVLAWTGTSATPITTTTLRVGSKPVKTVGHAGNEFVDIQTKKLDLEIRSVNTCGISKLTLDIDPVLTIGLEGDFSPHDLTPTKIEAITDSPVPEDLKLAVTISSPAFQLNPSTLTIVSGTSSATADLSFNPQLSPSVGNLSITVTRDKIDDLVVRMQEALPLVSGTTKTKPAGTARAVGNVSYTDPSPVSLGSRPVRHASVEIRDQSGKLVGAAETTATGDFEALIPAGVARASLRVCLQNAHVAVHLEHDVLAPLCIDFGQADVVKGLALLGNNAVPPATNAHEISFADKNAQGVNAFDVAVGADEYLTLAFPSFHHGRIRIIPKTLGSGVTLQGPYRSSNIWIPWAYMPDQWGMANDELVLHEIGHHVENMVGAFYGWGAVHDGCHVETQDVVRQESCTSDPIVNALVASSQQNDPIFAMQEGFATFFADAAADWGHGPARDWTAATGYGLNFNPVQACSFPSATTPATPSCSIVGFQNVRLVTIEETMVEDYVAAILTHLSRDATLVPREQAFGAILETLANTPFPPTYRKFRAEWATRHPAQNLSAHETTLFGKTL